MKREWQNCLLRVQENKVDKKISIRKQLRERGICVIISTFNNETTVERVVRDALEYCQDVFVVNDGCTDTTEEILNRINGINVISYKQNHGKGYALKQGFREAIKQGFAYAITIDSDGQHFPKDIPLFLKENVKYPQSLIIGERKLQGVIRTKGSNFANKFSNFWFYVQTGRKLNDTQTGYRLYPLKRLHYLGFLTSKYEAELSLMVFASWHGIDIHSVLIDVYYPPVEERISHFRPKKDFIRITILNIILCFLAVAYGLPMRLWRFLSDFIRTFYTAFVSIFSMMVVMTPIAWLILHIGKDVEKQRERLHRFMQRVSRFVMLEHGIPGVCFEIDNPGEEDFKKPAIIICNHQSHLDLVSLLIFHPKIVFLTNDWVWKNPIYGFIIRHAEYLPASKGVDELMPQLRSLTTRGYSVAIFPEGTRSQDCHIGRFHKGAVHVANELGIDILPMILYGPGRILPKTSWHLHKWLLKVFVKKRLTPNDLLLIGDERKQTQYLHKYYLEEYGKICNKLDQSYYG